MERIAFERLGDWFTVWRNLSETLEEGQLGQGRYYRQFLLVLWMNFGSQKWKIQNLNNLPFPGVPEIERLHWLYRLGFYLTDCRIAKVIALWDRLVARSHCELWSPFDGSCLDWNLEYHIYQQAMSPGAYDNWTIIKEMLDVPLLCIIGEFIPATMIVFIYYFDHSVASQLA